MTNQNIGIEFVFPNEAWRLHQHGIEVLASLFHQLSPYRDRPLTAVDFTKLADESACFLVAVDYARQGHIVGIARLMVKRDQELRYGEIHDVVVDTAYRHHGIGRALVEKLIALARLFHLGMVELTSKPARVAANQLYQKLGFELVEAASPGVAGSTNRYSLLLT